MTGYTVHTGSSDKFAAAWDRVFQGGAVSTSEVLTTSGAKMKKAVVQAKKVGAKKVRRQTTGKANRG